MARLMDIDCEIVGKSEGALLGALDGDKYRPDGETLGASEGADGTTNNTLMEILMAR